jgi:hypothetical protein
MRKDFVCLALRGVQSAGAMKALNFRSLGPGEQVCVTFVIGAGRYHIAGVGGGS